VGDAKIRTFIDVILKDRRGRHIVVEVKTGFHGYNVTPSLDTLARGRQIAETVSSIHQLRKKSNRGGRRLMIEISHIRSD
jgi:hypothetical protein